jgi:hypothetical protein
VYVTAIISKAYNKSASMYAGYGCYADKTAFLEISIYTLVSVLGRKHQ